MHCSTQGTEHGASALVRGGCAARGASLDDGELAKSSPAAARVRILPFQLPRLGSRTGRAVRPTLLTALLLVIVLVRNGVAATEPCATYSIGLDTTYATTRDGPFGGRADGQVFLARDTLVRSISVWRAVPPDTNYYGMKLFIAHADSTGRPNVANILLSGPTVVVPFGDGVHPIEYKWTFDPPLPLPARGHYWFGVQADPCYGFFDLLFNHHDAYKDGDNWRTLRLLPGEPCYLRAPVHYSDFDIIFKITFCDAATPVLPSSWGSVKIRFR